MCLFFALGVAACSDDDDSDSGNGGDESAQSGGSTEAEGGGGSGEGGNVKIAFSAPGADHGWMAAITENARKQAEELGDGELIATEGVTDSAAQADQIETLLSQKPDALIVLPNEGDALTPVAQKATASGIPVIAVDRAFDTPGAYRTFITGDNYGIGFQAGKYFGEQLK